MASDNYALWEERYSTPGRGPRQPEPFVVESLPYLRRGALLDVACGEGRHALYLASQGGFRVLGVDRSPTAIEVCRKRAAERGLEARFQELDLEREILPAGPFATIVATRYWQPDLCSQLVERLEGGGILLYESYTYDYLRYGPRRRDFLLAPGQLREVFAGLGLEILSYAVVDRPETREYSARLLARKV